MVGVKGFANFPLVNKRRCLRPVVEHLVLLFIRVAIAVTLAQYLVTPTKIRAQLLISHEFLGDVGDIIAEA